jgi:energy-coupling factor transporter ATP-binding protein EcfA2
VTIEQEIATWAANRPPWHQDVLRKLAQGHTFDQAAIDGIANDLTTPTPVNVAPLKATDVPGARAAGATVALRSIRDATNVNALLDGQQLTFAPAGLTVVYGDNGSGKSGYARLIKDAVGARHHEPVHANVFADTAGQPQKAEIGFISAGTERGATWPTGVDGELGAVSFYDEACGDAYVGGESELTYRPSALAMLDGLIAVCDAVRDVLDEHLRDNHARREPLPVVAQDTDAARFLTSLSGATTSDQLDAACALPTEATEQLGALIKEEARLRATDPSKERARLDTLTGKLDRVASHVAALEAALSDEKVSEATTARLTATELRAAANVASSDAFEDEPIAGVGSQTWRTLWEAARAFSEADAYHSEHFPVTNADARCVLCQQELTPSGAERLTRFEAFLQDTTAQRASAAELAAAQLTGAIRQLDITPAQVAADLVELEAADKELTTVAADWLQAAAARKTALLANLDGGDDAILTLDPSPHAELTGRAGELRAAASAIDATQFQATLANTVAKKNDLEGRSVLAQRRANIEAEIARLAERAKLEGAKRLTDTTGITRKASDLTDAHVTSLIRDRFTRESDRLRLERIELKKTGGQKGKLRHRPSLLGAKAPKPVDQVLSEGEQTALGLAGYFTEAHFDTSKSALVLDDPVTSLDHIRRGRVAQRLAELAQDRQVIVFTHDIAFVADLRRAADEAQVRFTERGVQRHGDNTPGLCTDQHPWKAKDVPRRFDELTQHSARIKRERANWDQDTYEKECSDWAGKLSETWERLINLEVVDQLVDRGTSEVRPKMFKLLVHITEDDNREFQQSYGRISAWVRRHDKSPSTNYVAPEPAELEEELAFVKGWFDRVRKYRNK